MIAAPRQVKTRSMDYGVKPGLAEQLAAALDWWRDAGVDGDLRDEAQGWITASVPEVPGIKSAPASPHTSRQPRTKAEPVIAAPIDRSGWPADLDGFAAWWLSEPWLDGGQVNARVLPRGAAGAELMIVVPEPEPEDSEHLLSGPQGRLLDAMLSAMGIAPGAVYLASALPRHTPHADWRALGRAGMGEVLQHHAALVAPRRMIIFGGNVLPLLNTDLAKKSDALSKFHHVGGSMPLLVQRELAILLERPRWKATVWQHWLAWNSRVSSAPITETEAT